MKKLLNQKERGSTVLQLSLALSASMVMVSTSFVASEITSVNKESNILAAILSDLEDIRFENPALGDTLIWDGESWVNGKFSLSDLGNANINNPQNGQNLIFNGVNWINGIAPRPNLESINGITVSNVNVGQVLTFNGTEWVNTTVEPPSINSLPDVNLSTTIESGSGLVYNGTQWVNGPEGKPGLVKMFPSSSAPAGWLIADGRAVSRTTYSQLFSVIGTTYGAGDGSTTFNLPDFRGRAPVGFNSGDGDFNSMGQTGGAKTHTLTSNEMPSHTHSQNSHSHGGSISGGAHNHSITLNSGGSHSTSHTLPSRISGSASGSTRNVSANTTRLRVNLSAGTTGAAGGHSHGMSIPPSHSGHTHSVSISGNTASNNNTGGGAAHNNLQPYIVMNFVIKF
jgi:microcystin-dependent protein